MPSAPQRRYRWIGPWDSEDDEVVWTTKAGLRARIVRHSGPGLAYWCVAIQFPDSRYAKIDSRNVPGPLGGVMVGFLQLLSLAVVLPREFRDRVGTCQLTWVGTDPVLGRAVGADFGHLGQFNPAGSDHPALAGVYVTQAMAAEACELWAARIAVLSGTTVNCLGDGI